MAFFNPSDFGGGFLPFEDRFGPTYEAVKSGQFDPQGANNLPPPGPPAMTNAQMFPGYGTGMAAGGPQAPEDGPPQGMPPQGYSMPSQPVVMPSLGGMAPMNRAPDIGDRLQAAGAGFFNAGSPMQAIGNLLGGLFTGQRQDPAGIRAQMFGQAQAASQQAGAQSMGAAMEYIAQDPNIPPPMKQALLRNPAMAMKYFSELAKPPKPPEYSAQTIENTGYTFDKTTGKWTPGVIATPKPEKPPANYTWRDPSNPAAGANRIPGTEEPMPPNAAAYLAMLESTRPALEKAKQFFLSEDFKGGPVDAAGKVIGQFTNSFEISRQRRSVEMAAEAALRMATGATAPPDEVKRYANFYTPSVYDSEETRRQKLEGLTRFMDYAKSNISRGRVPEPEEFMPKGGGKKSNDPLGIR
jgi:hypothetical protein